MKALRHNDVARFRTLFIATVVLGLLFLGIKGVEYADEFDRGLRPATSNFFGLYLVLTSLHALHLFGGIAVNTWVAASAHRWERRQLLVRAQTAVTYWQFVDAVWLVLFVVLYLL